MKEIIDRETEKILENRVYKYLRNPDGSRKDKAGWKRFGFPLFYQADLLEVMVTLTRLGVHDERMSDAVRYHQRSLSKKMEDGCSKTASTARCGSISRRKTSQANG